MSAISNYIISNSNELSSRMQQCFNDRKIEDRFQLSKKQLESKLKLIFKKEMLPVLKTNDDKEFFQLLQDIQKGVLNPSAEKMANELTLGLTAQEILTVTSETDIKKFISKLETAIETMNKVLKPIGEASFSNNLTAYLQSLSIVENLQKNTKNFTDDVKTSIRSFLIGNNYSFTVNNTFKNSFNEQKKNIQKSYANLKILEQLAKELKSNNLTTLPAETGAFTKSFLFSTFNAIGKILGIFSEDGLRENIELFLDEEIQKLFASQKNISFSTTASGTKSSEKFKVKTTDIEINLSIEDMLKGKEGKISVALPGISLKRTRANQQTGKIKIKTGASFETFKKYAGFNSKELQTFFSAMVNYRRSWNKKSIYSNVEGMKNMYAFLKVAMFPMAAAGSLNKDDFAYFLVINNKVYNVLEILEAIGAKGFESDAILNFSPSQSQIKNTYTNFLIKDRLGFTEANKRIVDKINKTTINYQLIRSFENKIK